MFTVRRAPGGRALSPTVGEGPYAPSYPGGIVTTTSRPVTPKFALNAQLTGNNLVYLSATKGFRIGGGQLPVPNYCGPDLIQLGYVKNGEPYTPPSYNPDYVWSYELGSKNTALDGKLRTEASVFYVNWQSIQTNVGLPVRYDVTNAGTATVKGFDLDAEFAPIHELQLRADLGYAHTSYDERSLYPQWWDGLLPWQRDQQRRTALADRCQRPLRVSLEG